VRIAILLYEQMTALDAIGPYEVLSRLPEADLRFVAEKAGPVTTDTGFLQLVARDSINEIDSADILLIPGGPGDEAVRANPALLEWVSALHQTTRYTTSVCTGSLVLAAAGLLQGVRATTHWTQLETLASLGASPVSERYVTDGKIVTAAGVSAGIDMALHLFGEIAGTEFAQMVQLGIEYDPKPPFDTGSPEVSPAPLVELVRATMTRPAEA
jgi:transcriptional regulator GlxA family with amidase domain